MRIEIINFTVDLSEKIEFNSPTASQREKESAETFDALSRRDFSALKRSGALSSRLSSFYFDIPSVREFRCFPRLLRTITVFTGVHSPFRVADVKESATSRARRSSLPRKGSKEESSDREHRYAVRILRMARGTNNRHERRYEMLFVQSGALCRAYLAFRHPRLRAKRARGTSSGHAGNVSYATDAPQNSNVMAKSGV